MMPRKVESMAEELSAWMDGELGGENARRLSLQLKRNAELRATWDRYHLIGDAVRGLQGPDLRARICARLETEPTVFAPKSRSAAEKPHWHALSSAAGVVVVAFVGWMLWPVELQDTAKSKVAQIAMPAGEVANHYLLAHQRHSPSSAMQGVAAYVRVVAAEQGDSSALKTRRRPSIPGN